MSFHSRPKGISFHSLLLCTELERTDFAGLSGRSPSFSKSYLNLRELLTDAATRYRTEVAEGAFPTKDQSF